MDQYKVSILVPVYKVEKYIRRCAISLFSQSLENIEFIFIDDFSTDNSINILKEVVSEYPHLTDRLQIICHNKNMGVAAARSTALNNAVGTYVLFVDSDDYIEPTMVEHLYNKAIEVNADMVFCSFFNEFNNAKTEEFQIRPINDKKELIKSTFSNPSFWNKLFKRELIETNNLEIMEGVDYGEDLALIPRLVYYSNTFAFIEKPLYHYVLYNDNALTKRLTNNHIKQTLKVVQLLSNFFKNKEESYNDLILQLKASRKAKILRSGRIEKEYIDLFPELKSKINKLDLDYKTKIILLLALNNKKILLKLFVSLLIQKGR